MGPLMVNFRCFKTRFSLLSFLNESFAGNVFLLDLFPLCTVDMSFWSLSFLVATEKSAICLFYFIENLFFSLLMTLCVIIYN